MLDPATRRSFLVGLAAAAAPLRARAAAPAAEDRLNLGNKQLAWIEEREGGRLGVAVIDTETGWTLEHRADERFPMCSTFKLLAAAAALKRVDDGASGSTGLSLTGRVISSVTRRSRRLISPPAA